ALGVEVELGDLAALVGDLEGHVARGSRVRGDGARGVRRLDLDRPACRRGRVALAVARGERHQGGGAGEHGQRGSTGHAHGHSFAAATGTAAAFLAGLRKRGSTTATYATQAMACSTVVCCE